MTDVDDMIALHRGVPAGQRDATRHPRHLLSFAKTPSAGQVVDLSALIRREWPSHDHHAALAPPLPVPLRRPPPARPREPRPAPAAHRLQEDGGPAEVAPRRPVLLGRAVRAVERLETGVGHRRPSTVLCWPRRRFRDYWTRRSLRSVVGRPPVAPELRALV